MEALGLCPAVGGHHGLIKKGRYYDVQLNLTAIYIFFSLGVNGKHCVLKTLCLVGKVQDDPQGMFFQEIMRAVFT